MKVLIFSPVGENVHIRKIPRALAQNHNVNVSVIAPREAVIEKTYSPSGWLRLDKEQFIDGYHLIPVPLKNPQNFSLGFQYSFLPRVIKRLKPDIIQVWGGPCEYILQVVCAKLASFPKARIIYYGFNNLPPRFNKCSHFFWKIIWTQLAGGVEASSEGVKVIRGVGFNPPLERIFWGIQTDIFTQLDKESVKKELGLSYQHIVGYVGRFVPEKGLSILLEAIAKLPLTTHCILIGNGPMAAELKLRSEKADLQGRVHFFDPMAAEKLVRYMNCFDVLSLPSITMPHWKEQYGRVIGEAMACGVPVIGSNSGAIPEVIGDAGIVVPENNPKALSSAFAEVINHENTKERLIKSGLSRAQKELSVEAMSNRLLDFYEMIGLWSMVRPHKNNVRVYNIGSNLPRNALVSYTTAMFRVSPEAPSWFGLNVRGCCAIIRALNRMGYAVDLIEYNDTKSIPRKEYDLFIGHAGYNFEHIARRLPSHACKIYYSTGVYWKTFNLLEEERFRQLEERKGVSLPFDRWIHASEEFANQSADGIICLGNQEVKNSYSKFPLVINMNNFTVPDHSRSILNKDFSKSCKNFLFLAGAGNVHKGLDLLLEAFSQVDAHLYICQRISREFRQVYQRELEDMPNIHLIGEVPLRSRRFYELMDTCAFVIHPSCAEGQPASVIECMQHGLIPIISRHSHIDTDGFGVILEDCTIDEILAVVKKVSQFPLEEYVRMSGMARKNALENFSDDCFFKNMKEAIRIIIEYSLKHVQH